MPQCQLNQRKKASTTAQPKVIQPSPSGVQLQHLGAKKKSPAVTNKQKTVSSMTGAPAEAKPPGSTLAASQPSAHSSVSGMTGGRLSKKAAFKEAERLRKAAERARESPAMREERLKRNREQMAAARCSETLEETKARQQRDRERKAAARSRTKGRMV